MDFFSSEEIVASLGDKAKMKGKLSFVRLCILGIMAGFCIALGYLAFIRITGTAPTEWGSFNNFLGGALFPVGLIALTFVGGELATGNMMVMTLGVLQKKVRVGTLCYNWLVVLLTNCLGGFLVAYLFGHIVGLTEGAFLDKTVAVAQAKIADPPLVAFVSGIGCNIFVCLAVYLGALAKSSTRGRQCVYYSSGNFFTKYHNQLVGLFAEYIMGIFRQCSRWQSFYGRTIDLYDKTSNCQTKS